MADNYDEKARKKSLAESYQQKLRERDEERKKMLTAAQYDFFRNFGAGRDTSVREALERAMSDPKTVVSEYVAENLGWLFGTVIPEHEKKTVLYFADRLGEYSYEKSYNRRSFRSKNNAAYVDKLHSIISGYGYNHIIGATVEQVLTRELDEDALAYLDEYPWQGSGYNPWQLAYALDNGSEVALEAVRRIITEKNGMGEMSWQLVSGVLISHRSDLHELLGKLLLAAKLQEGVRQTICEHADEGTREGFLAILRVIAENGLIRFSSVKRAVGTWLGLMTDETRDLERVSEKSVRLIVECLESESARKENFASDDAMKIYIALWSYGFDAVETAAEKLEAIAEEGLRHRLLVAGCFARNLHLPRLENELAKKVIRLHRGEEDVLAVWLPRFISERSSILWEAAKLDKALRGEHLFGSKEEMLEYYTMMRELHGAFRGKEKTFFPCVFPWNEEKLKKSQFAELICVLSVMLGDNDKIDEACAYVKECDISSRYYCMTAMLRRPATEVQRRTLMDCLADKESDTRRKAYEIACELELTAEECRYIESFLRFKYADIRVYVTNLLMKQDDLSLRESILRLLESPKEDIRFGGLDMILRLKKDEKRSALAAAFEAKLAERARAENLPEKEKILLGELLPKNDAEEKEPPLCLPEDKYTPAEFDEEYAELCIKTFSEYFPESDLPELVCGKKYGKGALIKLKNALLDTTVCRSAAIAASDILSLARLIEEHKEDSFVNQWGQTVIISNITHSFTLKDKDGELPLRELWNEWIKKNGITNKRIVCAAVLYNAAWKWNGSVFTASCADFVRKVFGAGFETAEGLPCGVLIRQLLAAFCESVPRAERARLASALALWFMRCVPDDMVMVRSAKEGDLPPQLSYAHLLAQEQFGLVYSWLSCKNDDELKYTFPLAVAVSNRCASAFLRICKTEGDYITQNGRMYYVGDRSVRYLRGPYGVSTPYIRTLAGVNEYLLAAYRGIITEPQLYEYMLSEENIRSAMEAVSAIAVCYYENGKKPWPKEAYKTSRYAGRIINFFGKDTAPNEEDMKAAEFVASVYEKLVPHVLSAELRRGDSATPYTHGIYAIVRLYGAGKLAAILASLGSDTLDRNARSGYGSPSSRKSALSYLLSACVPAEGDTAKTLGAALEGKQVTKKRLIEAALFSPEWIPIIGEYLGIPSFSSVCYYFMAHMNESFDDKRKAMIARFTPLSEDELNLGAFDIGWFRSAYESIGEAEFELIYDAAKYISDGAKHARARKYADAATGKLTAEETENTVSDKRNKDLLMAYALIPLEGEDDICRRYLYIQRFRKESKQFGSQRIASEAKAVETALTNLAMNAGYSDSMRLTLRMETKVIDDSRELLEEHTVEGVVLKICLDENGKASLTAAKDGKALKSVPAKLKKHEKVLALTDMVKTLTEQYRRTRVMLERAMEEGTAFTFAELSALSAHPVVYPMLKNLVLISGEHAGFLAEKGLADDAGNVRELQESAEMKIAHPFHLYSMGCWRDYQKYLFENKITQPFRQVFRELYIKTADEAGTYHSLRYAGNQIQPAKTVGALKSRRWVADVEDGLQKVYYKENIVAEIYALADWFSPADIEAPTLEWVCFSDRKTGEQIMIDKIPDIVFSEVMRDVDLAVSVAHAGGVDPEASHSTVEMRAAILSFVLPMFRIANVRVEGHHAIIKGKLAEYSVHLGSGVVHQLGGAMIPVLPVHSQHRGKIFLPFVDDDPKTAEVISKVLLFAEDGKIKDPMILSCISK